MSALIRTRASLAARSSSTGMAALPTGPLGGSTVGGGEGRGIVAGGGAAGEEFGTGDPWC